MRTTAKRLASITAACMICSAPVVVAAASADAASPAKRTGGTSFAAATAVGGVQITISNDHHQVRHALFAYKSNCSDGDTFYDYDVFTAIPIGANRKFSFSYESPPQPSSTTPGATFSYTVSINGQLNKAGTKIVGNARSTSGLVNPAGGSYTCDTGSIKYIAKD